LLLTETFVSDELSSCYIVQTVELFLYLTHWR